MNKLIKGNINVVRVEQLPGRDGKPGGIKIQLPNKNAKIEVLRAKKSLVKTADYSRDSISETKPVKTSRRTSWVEYGDILIFIGNSPYIAKITVSRLKYSPITVKLNIFKMAPTKLP